MPYCVQYLSQQLWESIRFSVTASLLWTFRSTCAPEALEAKEETESPGKPELGQGKTRVGCSSPEGPDREASVA